MSQFRSFRWAVGPGIKHVRLEMLGQTAMKRSLLRPNWKRLFKKWNGCCFTGQVFSLGEHLTFWGGLAVALHVQVSPLHGACLSAETWEKILKHTENRSWHKVYSSFSFLCCGVGLVRVFFEGWVVSAQLQSCIFVWRYCLIEGTFSSSL